MELPDAPEAARLAGGFLAETALLISTPVVLVAIVGIWWFRRQREMGN